MKGALIWGTGLQDVARKADPDLLQKASPSWAFDIEKRAPWHPQALGFEGKKSRCWLSHKEISDSPLIISGPCSSAMDLAWYFIQNTFLPEWGSVLALNQWAGRGQLGREWHSPTGNIFGAFRLPSTSEEWSNVSSLTVGYAFMKSFLRMGVDIQLKWPNDLVVNNKKVGGILVEEKEGVIIAGVGLNLASHPPQAMLRGEGIFHAGSFSQFGYDFTPLGLWSYLMKTGRDYFENIIKTDHPSRLMEGIRDRLAFVGEKVRVEDHSHGACEGTLVGLSRDGGLKLFSGEKMKIIRSGSLYPSTK